MSVPSAIDRRSFNASPAAGLRVGHRRDSPSISAPSSPVQLPLASSSSMTFSESAPVPSAQPNRLSVYPMLPGSRSSVSLYGSGGGQQRPVSSYHGRTPSVAPPASFDQAHLIGSLGAAGQHALVAHDKTLELYRANAKRTNDPTVQFEFAQFLIRSALTIPLNPDGSSTTSGKPSSSSSPHEPIDRPPSAGSLHGLPNGLGRQPLHKSQSSMSATSQSSSGSIHSAPSMFTADESTSTPMTSMASSSTAATGMTRSQSDGLSNPSSLPIDPAKKREKLLREAAAVLRKLADRSHPDAQYLLADALSSGLLGRRDLREAFVLFVSATKHGHSEAAYRAALCYEEGWGTATDVRKAVQFLRVAAAKNHPGAMLKLGVACYYNQLGLAHKQRDGVRWLSRAAETANEIFPQAPYELAGIYEKGFLDIIIPDEAYAAQLYVKSAELGYAPAATRLGYAYENGILTCPQDPALSVHYYTIAALAGDPQAMLSLCAWYMVGAPSVLERNEEEAFEWARKAAEVGLPKAMFAVGHFCEAGVGTKRDMLEANVWYTRAAEHGEERATTRLNVLNGRNANAQGKEGEKKKKKERKAKDKENATVAAPAAAASTGAKTQGQKEKEADNKDCVIM
ncbi:hypothetical protein BZA70DRAFT_278409 [Myxozyma melibiosi]|uniref:HCP-like protein n=1 Tax=Myxozyma melibiosi TaxID=54550 RepID=A0ABR1F8Z0_9ASCO